MGWQLSRLSATFLIGLVLFLLQPVYAQGRVTLEGRVTRVEGPVVEISVETDRGLKVGDEGVVSYELEVGGRMIPLKIARVKVTEISGGLARARVIDSTVPIQRGYAVTFQITVATPCVGNIFVQTTPQGASVALNENLEAGATPLLIEQVPCGVVRVKATLPGHQDAEGEARVERNGVAKVALTLVRATGSLTVTSSPAGAQVTVDGRLVGTTPVFLADLHAGTYQVRVFTQGYQPYEAAVGISAGESARLDARLTAVTSYLFEDDFRVTPALPKWNLNPSYARIEFGALVHDSPYTGAAVTETKESFGNFRLRVEIEKVSGPEHVGFGILLKTRPGPLLFGINGNSSYAVAEWDPSEKKWALLQKWERSHAIRPGNVRNEFELSSNDGEFRFSVNGTFLTAHTLKKYDRMTPFALFSSGGMIIRFREVKMVSVR